jgi:hypothetical protein
MANFLGGGGPVNKPPTPATRLRVQTAVNGVAIPIVHGQQRVAGNLIDYWGFAATPQSNGSGKGGFQGGGGKGSGTTSYTYSATVMIALAEGPIDRIEVMWNNKSPRRLDVSSDNDFVVFAGAQGQADWGFLDSNNAEDALGYSSLAYVAAENLALGNSPELQNFGFEVKGAISGALVETYEIAAPYAFAPRFWSLAASVAEQVAVPAVAPYQLRAAGAFAKNALPVVLGDVAHVDIPSSASNGVIYAATGLPLTQVASSPATGQYAVSPSGLYTFAAGDAGASVIIIDFAVSPGVYYAFEPTATLIAGSTAVTGLSTTTGLVAGQLVSGAGIPPGTVLQTVSGTSAALSQAATQSGSVILTVYGTALKQVLGTPGQGEYSVSVTAAAFGVYQFAAADAGATVAVIDVPDADPAASLTDFLTNPRYGCGFPPQNLGSLATLQDWAYANGLFISPALTQAAAANGYLGDFSTGLCGEFVWSNGLLTWMPYGDTAASGNGKSYTPPSPICSLGDDDYLPNEGTSSVGVSAFTSDDPVVCVRKRQSDAYNDVKLEFLDRGNAYNPAIVEAKDDAAIDLYGLRPAQSKQLHFFCSESAAMASAQLQLGRQQIRNQYSFTVPWYFILLDPMDVIAITDAALGLVAAPVRILEITENQQDWSLTVTAEDFLAGPGVPAPAGTQVKSGYAPQYNIAPGAIVEPVIIEPPEQIATTGGLELWILTGSATNYGGADVWLSRDGDTYQNVGRIANGAQRVGFLTAALPAAADPDTTDTLTVDLAATGGQLASGSAADAAAAATLCVIAGYPVPAAPALAATPGGALAAQTIYVRISYVFAAGEGPASAADSLALAAGTLLTAASPATLSGATGWHVYAGTAAGAEVRQTATALAIGASWTEPTSGLATSGAAPLAALAGYELISYETATLVSGNAYDLGTYLGRGLYGSAIASHPAGAQFARLDGTQFVLPYNKSQIGQTIYVKLTPFNQWGGGELTLDEVQPFAHVIEGPPAPAMVQGFQAQQNGGSVLCSWTDLPFPASIAYDILYGPVGGSVEGAVLVTEASRATSETTVSIPPGSWTIYIRGHDLASGLLGPAAAQTITVANTNTPIAVQASAPDWLGAKSGFLVHYTGLLVPDQTVLASALGNAALFTQFCPAPVADPSYTTLLADTLFTDTLRIWYALAANPGPGIAGQAALDFSLDAFPAGTADPGVFLPWTIGTVLARFFKARIVENAAVPAPVAALIVTADGPTVTETVQGFAVAASGTALAFAAVGAGPYHGPPAVLVTPTDGVSTSGGASAISALGCTIQLFQGGSPVAGTCNIAIVGE